MSNFSYKNILKKQIIVPFNLFQEPKKIALFVCNPYKIKKYYYQRRGYDMIEEIYKMETIEEKIKSHVDNLCNGDSLFLYIFQNDTINWEKLLQSITKKINIFIISDGFHLTNLPYAITRRNNSLIHLNKNEMLYKPSIIIVENMETKFPLYNMFEFILSGFKSSEMISLQKLLYMMHTCHSTQICIYLSSPDLMYYNF
jgi:hypothetical protein